MGKRDDYKKVSIVMCTYNGDRYLKEQLDSILNQTYPIYEIIIQDDCSIDKTWDVILSFQAKFPIIKCFQNETNIGVNANFKTAFLRASGDYIAPSDQDDIWYPHKIESLVSTINDKLCTFSMSRVLFTDGSLGDHPFPLDVNLEQSIFHTSISGHTCMFSSAILDEIRFARNIDLAFDSIISLIVYAKKSFVLVNEYLQIWRRHPNAITKGVMNSSRSIINEPIHIDIGRKKRILFVLKNLLKGNKSLSIERHFNEVSNLLHFVDGKYSTMGRLSTLLAKQDIKSYILAGFYFVKYRDKFFVRVSDRSGLKYSIAFISFAFRYPFTYWYDNHLEPYL